MGIKVIKFGGTSVGSADRMIQVIQILRKQEDEKLIVLSAMSGTTNALTEIADMAATDKDRALKLIGDLSRQYIDVNKALFNNDLYVSKGQKIVDSYFDDLKRLIVEDSGRSNFKEVVAIGELLSTHLFALKCEELGIDARVMPALDFMRLDEEGEPDMEQISKALLPKLNEDGRGEWLITQGYICRNHKGKVDNLKRGGSDYTATIIGAVTNADEIQIWTDIDGIHNNDPRVVKQTNPIHLLSYREAAELAYFGAKILHPTCVLPAERAGVPLRLKYTMAPERPGTLIGKDTSKRPITAIAAKDGITAIKIYSHRMLMAYGFLRKVFQIFESHRTSIDMITTSEVAVSVTIDQAESLDQIKADLSQYGEVEAVGGYTVICIVGNALYDDPAHVHKIFAHLENIPLRMVSMGGSRYNLSVLVKTTYKEEALTQLNKIFYPE